MYATLFNPSDFKLSDIPVHITLHKELVCLGCGSENIFVLVAKGAVYGCVRCKRIEKLPCMEPQKFGRVNDE